MREKLGWVDKWWNYTLAGMSIFTFSFIALFTSPFALIGYIYFRLNPKDNFFHKKHYKNTNTSNLEKLIML